MKLELGDYKGAIKDCDKAISLDPKHAYAYNNRGAAKYHLGDYKGALEDCDKSISLDSENAYAYLNRADIKLKLGYTGGAITDYAKAARLFRAQGLDAKAKDAWDRASKL
ncbi:MAG: tetratricopeptide repeat protein [Candidatus Micrarchaeota archaeon]|nr:tetratricopeptide repeat protein [Candidatus Micrarchaeota archaeon]